MEDKNLEQQEQANNKNKSSDTSKDNTNEINLEEIVEGINIEELAEEDLTETGGNQPIAQVSTEAAELRDKYLRLMADFDNFRRRTAKERIEQAKVASKDVIIDLLPVLDDFERAFQAQTTAGEDGKGFALIYNKLLSVLQAKGLKAMNAKGEEFNADFHEALTEIPAPSDELKGKVVDEIEKGYYLNDKIIRYAKVVVGK